MKLNLLAVLAFSLTILSCSKSSEKQAEEDDELIAAYIAENNMDATKTESGLYYTMDTVGTGSTPGYNAYVKVAYTGYKLDGTIFDASTDAGTEFWVDQLIPGFSEGLTYFAEGGKGTLLIPSGLGYGDNWAGNLSPNTVLLFDIHLIDVVE